MPAPRRSPSFVPGQVSRRDALRGGLGLTAAALLPAIGRAAPARLNGAVHDELRAGGWSVVNEGGDTRGVTLRKKTLSSLGRTAWQGECDLDPRVEGARFFALLCDTAGHLRFMPGLAASEVISRDGSSTAFFQVLKAPAFTPLADRFWISESRGWAKIGGDPQRYRRAWSSQAAPLYDDVRAQVLARFPGAVEVGFTHGTWEVSGAEGGGLHVIFSVVSDPGGAIPKGMASTIAGHNISDTIRLMERQSLT